MLTRFYIMVIASLLVEDIIGSILHNDSYNISSIIANNAGRFQKSLNQISSNRAANLQQSFNSLKSANLEQTQHSHQNLNLPPHVTPLPGGLQPLNPHSAHHSALNNDQAKGLQSSIYQQPANFQQSTQVPNTNNLPLNGNNFEPYNPMLNQQIIQQSPGISSAAGLTQHLPLQPQVFQGPAPNSMISQPIIQEIPTFIQPNNINHDVNSLIFQNEQISGLPPYLLDTSQPTNLATLPHYDHSQFSPLVPTGNQQSIGFGQTEVPNQFTMTNSGQPSIYSNPPGYSNYVNSASPVTTQSFVPTPYSAPHPSSATRPYQQESSSSSLQALLPLILNLMKDNNNHGYCQSCGCSKMKNYQQGQNTGGSCGGNSRDSKCGCMHDGVVANKNAFSGDNENHNTKKTRARPNGIRNGKVVKIEESYEDFDDDDYDDEIDYD